MRRLPAVQTSGAEWVPPSPPDLPEACFLDEAEAICREELAADSRQPRFLHLRGLLAARARDDDIALACLMRAAELSPTTAEYVLDLAPVLERMGSRPEALAAWLRAIQLEPGNADIYRQLANALLGQGRRAEALAMCHECLRLRSDDAATIGLLGDVLHAQGRLADALERYETALRLQPRNADRAAVADRADLHGRLGRLRLTRREWTHALEAFQEGVRLNGGRADLHAGIGEALVRLRAPEEALAAFREALSINPLDVNTCRQFVCACELFGLTGDAVDAWLQLAAALEAHGSFEDAAAAYRQTLARKPDCLRALLGLGSVHLILGQPEEAVRRLQAAVAIDPQHLNAHFKLGWACQLSGETDRGWDEFRWLCHPARLKTWRAFEQPMWDGSTLSGRTILLWAGFDYGLGDTIHLVRYAQAAKARGARVVVECQPRLVPLMQRAEGVDQIVTRGGPLPPFDVHAPLIWVPCIDRTARPPTSGNVPYLSVDDVFSDFWRERLGSTGCRTVGLSWGGKSTRRDAHHRFAPLKALAPLAGTAGVRFVGLQMGPQADERFNPPSGLRIDWLQDDSSSILDTAALILHLDLVITVDTLVAHVAGALARPVWAVLPFAADWKWLNGEDTHWYPTMRLFRQRRRGDWVEVFQRVRAALDDWTSSSARPASVGRLAHRLANDMTHV